MLRRLDLRDSNSDLAAMLASADAESDAPTDAVARIIRHVRDGGDNALHSLTEEFDGVKIGSVQVTPQELKCAFEACDPELIAALELARDQICAYHETQALFPSVHQRMGVRVEDIAIPVDRAGCYVPGGRATYPSSVLMTVIPAKVAGVRSIALCTPPGLSGSPADVTLAAALIAGADEVYRVGGVQAIAALAYGTESIVPVDVIVGPGNAYVTEAKRQVIGEVGIDALAGPSELVVIADSFNDPRLVAADMLAQAEHGPGGKAVLVTSDESVADEVEMALDQLLAVAPRRADAEATLRSGGLVVLVRSTEQAVEVSNKIAPEHLQLMCAGADDLIPLVRNAGAVFVGELASAVVGDYVAGTNHVLPTGGAARYQSALRVSTFQKHVHLVRVDNDGLASVGPAAIAIAEAEGLDAHAQSIRVRLASS